MTLLGHFLSTFQYRYSAYLTLNLNINNPASLSDGPSSNRPNHIWQGFDYDTNSRFLKRMELALFAFYSSQNALPVNMRGGYLICVIITALPRVHGGCRCWCSSLWLLVTDSLPLLVLSSALMENSHVMSARSTSWMKEGLPWEASPPEPGTTWHIS